MTEQLSVEQGNKLIAEFDKRFPVPKYHSSWDWLMPVWSKVIKSLSDINNTGRTNLTNQICAAICNVEIKEAHKLIVREIEFIKWYNQNKQ